MDKESATPGAEPPVQDTNNTNGVVPEPAPANIQEDTVIVEATPVVMSTPEPAPAAEAASVQSDNTVLIKPPKKKFSLAAIIGFVVFGLLLVGGIGFAIWYFVVYQNPQNIAFDAVNNFFSAEHVQMDGGFTVTIDDEDNDTAFAYNIRFKNESKTLPNATTATLTMSEVDDEGNIVDGHEVSLDIGAAVMSDGVIYFQVAKLAEALDSVVTDESFSKSEIGQAVYDIVELVDNEWWKISIPEIIDELDMGSSGKPIKDLYSCIISAAKSDYMNEYADFYRANQFVSITKNTELSKTIGSGHTYYDITLDYDRLAGFLNELPHSKYSTEVTACYNTYAEATGGEKISADDADKITAADLKGEMPEDLEIYLQVSDFEHKLEAVAFNMPKSEDGYSLTGAIGFIYEAGEVSAPDNYRSISELIEDAIEIITPLFMVEDGRGNYYYYDNEGDLWEYDSAFDSIGV